MKKIILLLSSLLFILTACDSSSSPSVSIDNIQNNVRIGDSVQLSASLSNLDSSQIESWEWSIDNRQYNVASPNHRFTRPGQRTISLTVTTAQGQTITDSMQSQIADRPQLSATVDYRSMTMPPADKVRLDDRLLFSASGDANLKQVYWEVPDGTVERIREQQWHATELGTHTVHAYLYGSDDSFRYVPVQVEVVENLAPVISVWGSGPQHSSNVLSYSARASYDPDGEIVAYEWDLGDGTVKQGVTVEHSYQESGTFSPVLTVTDNEGISVSKSLGEFSWAPQPRGPLQIEAIKIEDEERSYQLRSFITIGNEEQNIATRWFYGNGKQTTRTRGSHKIQFEDDGLYIVEAYDDREEPGKQWVSIQLMVGEQNDLVSAAIRQQAPRDVQLSAVTGDPRLPLPWGTGAFPLTPIDINANAPVIGSLGHFPGLGDRDRGLRPSVSYAVNVDEPTLVQLHHQQVPSRVDFVLAARKKGSDEWLLANVDSVTRQHLRLDEAGDWEITIESTLTDEHANYRLNFSQGAASSASVISGELLVRDLSPLQIHALGDQIGLSSSLFNVRNLNRQGPVRMRLQSSALYQQTQHRILANFRFADHPELQRHRQQTATVRTAARLQKSLPQGQVSLNMQMSLLSNATSFSPAFTPQGDPLRYVQWWLDDIEANEAHKISKGRRDGSPVVVAVVDSGMMLTHPDLRYRLVDGHWGFYNQGSLPDGEAHFDMHGTHVAGIVAASMNNQEGGASVAPEARLLSVNVFGHSPYSDMASIMEGIRYAAGLPNESGATPPHVADIINLSLGSPASYQEFSANTMFAQLIREVNDKGIVVVAAAGNDPGLWSYFPASVPGVVSVAANNQAGQPNDTVVTGYGVDIRAPGMFADGGEDALNRGSDRLGSAVKSTGFQTNNLGEKVPIYTSGAGSSMAAPMVSGAVALMKAVNPEITVDTFYALLLDGDLTNPVDDAFFPGQRVAPMVNLHKAVLAAQRTLEYPVDERRFHLYLDPIQRDMMNVFRDFDRIIPLEVTQIAGDEALRVSGIHFDDGVVEARAIEVDSYGRGRYHLVLGDTATLPHGDYFTVGYLEDENGRQYPIPLAALIPQRQHSEALSLYAELRGADGQAGYRIHQLTTAEGELAIDFQVPPGRYYLRIGTDIAGTGELCSVGNICGEYQIDGEPAIIELDESNSVLPAVEWFWVPFTEDQL